MYHYNLNNYPGWLFEKLRIKFMIKLIKNHYDRRKKINYQRIDRSFNKIKTFIILPTKLFF